VKSYAARHQLGADKLTKLLEEITQLAAQDKNLTEDVAALTRQIHELLTLVTVVGVVSL
jgi:hypothetical protein